MTTLQNPLGYRTSISYNAFDLPVALMNPLGYVSTTIDGFGRIPCVTVAVPAGCPCTGSNHLETGDAIQHYAQEEPAWGRWNSVSKGNSWRTLAHAPVLLDGPRRPSVRRIPQAEGSET